MSSLQLSTAPLVRLLFAIGALSSLMLLALLNLIS
ncbi:hypothetical protein PMIT1342_00500 [Prochlorococcus marinus str. MIT 1342]|uniref:Uncharacterized protein n=1 Tax=Prochlorococcus marinus (strain MIT 9313) TaxID=74547 RepID=B9ESE5_PROMM|nr:hypothetical protein PMIT1303_00303 [Prochlorococcus sp. MIT 1303]KZR73089.1 hypothetical protein PMIT1318_00677 [Prochlorococcus marinus str. MIT 1318]KZR77178.1 hypothetical protein PMIT1320_00466 [Prochlorococcus marinus str. MIT 1320]KZR83141.1 hypothetical protein PMIT1342_00500 [Prochlorococcus marinus str. MIT 1342]CAI8236099.1 MAG: Uncharacterised protein [Prochlorococcus marinus str. MIT 9313]